MTPDEMIDRLRRDLHARTRPLENDGSPAASGNETARAYAPLRLGLLPAQRGEPARLHADGEIGDAARRRIQQQLDLEEAGLATGSTVTPPGIRQQAVTVLTLMYTSAAFPSWLRSRVLGSEHPSKTTAIKTLDEFDRAAWRSSLIRAALGRGYPLRRCAGKSGR